MGLFINRVGKQSGLLFSDWCVKCLKCSSGYGGIYNDFVFSYGYSTSLMTLYLGWIIGIPLVLLSFNIFLLIIKKKIQL